MSAMKEVKPKSSVEPQKESKPAVSEEVWVSIEDQRDRDRAGDEDLVFYLLRNGTEELSQAMQTRSLSAMSAALPFSVYDIRRALGMSQEEFKSNIIRIIRVVKDLNTLKQCSLEKATAEKASAEKGYHEVRMIIGDLLESASRTIAGGKASENEDIRDKMNALHGQLRSLESAMEAASKQYDLSRGAYDRLQSDELLPVFIVEDIARKKCIRVASKQGQECQELRNWVNRHQRYAVLGAVADKPLDSAAAEVFASEHGFSEVFIDGTGGKQDGFSVGRIDKEKWQSLVNIGTVELPKMQKALNRLEKAQREAEVTELEMRRYYLDRHKVV